MKQFFTEVSDSKDHPSEDTTYSSPIEVEVDGRKVVFSGVTSGQLLSMIAMEGQDEMSRLATVLNFFFSAVENDTDKAWLRSRLFNRKDKFSEGIIADIVLYLVEEWSTRPTQPSSDSPSTQQSTGESSTESAPVVVLSPSTSPPPGS